MQTRYPVLRAGEEDMSSQLLVIWLAGCAADSEDSGAASDDLAMPDMSGHTLARAWDDSEQDGVPEITAVNVYGAGQRLTSYREEQDDYLYTLDYTYDDDGCTTHAVEVETIDDDAQGEEWTATCVDGEPVAIAVRVWSDFGEGTYDLEIYDVTENSFVVLRTIAKIVEGVVESTVRHVWTWQDGILVRADSYGNQSVGPSETWELDADANLSAYTYAHPTRESWSYREEWQRDARHRPTDYIRYEGAGLAEVAETRTTAWKDQIYEADRVEFDLLGDGVLDAIATYDCTDAWPWSCTVVLDGSEQYTDNPPDGELEYTCDFSWSRSP
jgi:hypothetical protein